MANNSQQTPDIRPVMASEFDVWQQLFESYAKFYKVSIPEGGESRVWEWIHDADEPFWCDVAELDNHVIGFTQYQLMHRSLSGERVVYLSDLFVEPDTRGSGTGRLLIDHVFSFARHEGISNVRWLTQDFNYRARELYDSYGSKSDFILYSFPV